MANFANYPDNDHDFDRDRDPDPDIDIDQARERGPDAAPDCDLALTPAHGCDRYRCFAERMSHPSKLEQNANKKAWKHLDG